MARLPRFFAPDYPLHVIQRGNNRQALFFDEEDYLVYLTWLGEAAARQGCAIHAYVLMTNHVHVLLTPEQPNSLPKTFQSLGRRYVQYINTTYQRTGTLWEGRYRATLIESEVYLLTCCRYIELNPIRAEMVAHPRAYPWSKLSLSCRWQTGPLAEASSPLSKFGPNGGGAAESVSRIVSPPSESRNAEGDSRGHE